MIRMLTGIALSVSMCGHTPWYLYLQNTGALDSDIQSQYV